MHKETANNPGIRLPWAGKLVHLELVEQELALLWKISADNLRTGQNTNVRTSVLNFVICAPDIAAAQHASALLRQLSSTHIARAAVVVLDRNNPTATISTWITLRCFSIISDIMRHCFEQTTLLVTGDATRSIANVLQPLLKPDLPVYLWWLGDPPHDDITFSRFVEISNRVIVDSATFLHPEQDMRTLIQRSLAEPDCALSDLNWERLTPWRNLIGQFFDVAEHRPYLEGINTIEIEHAVSPENTLHTKPGTASPNPAQALLLAGWLKDRLGWTFIENSKHNVFDTESGTYYWTMAGKENLRTTRKLNPSRNTAAKLSSIHPASVNIHPQLQPEMQPGSICLIRLTSTVAGKEAIFTINRDGDPEHVLTTVELDGETGP
ncbi:MAG: glucose-6-phosphate dehydrogenase assembly protein OpcA, partial [Chloroflexota bacterium]|nr:glucose-6-phosphate dehydrogenase assembly protein OpcA [Chloroflexota bacterium]